MIVGGWGIYGAFYLCLGEVGAAPWALWPLFATYGLFLAATEGAEKALVADMTPPNRLGTAYGWFNLTTGLLLLPASLLFGALWEHLGPRAAFAFSAACALGAALLLVGWVRIPQEQPHRPSS